MRTVVLTGVSRGLGEALLDALLTHAGTRVVALGRRFTGEQCAGDHLRLITTDFAEPATLPDCATLTDALAGSTEVALVLNAAVIGPIGPVGTLAAAGQAAELAAAVTANLTAPMLLTDAFLAAVPASARSIRLIFLSSGAAQRPIEGWAAYCATKAGGEAYFRVVAAEAARRDRRVTVACVNPGVMDTGMQAALRAADFPDRERYVQLHEAGRLPSPGAVAQEIINEHLPAGS